MKIHVFKIGDLDTTGYDEARARYPVLEFEFTTLPRQTFPLTKYTDWFSLDYDALEPYRTEIFNQVYFDFQDYSERILCSAKLYGSGQNQMAQVLRPNPWTEPVHEFIHQAFAFYGLPDTLHAQLQANQGSDDVVLDQIMKELDPYLMKGCSMLFPLKTRLPIYGTGINAWRTDPRTGRKFKHNGQDYRARFESLRAPFDCSVMTFVDYIGGNMMRLTGADFYIVVAHLSKYIVRSGEVKRGDIVAITGATGSITVGTSLPPHLHLEVRDKSNRILNPESLFWEDGKGEEDMLLRNSKGEISYLSPKGIRHPISGLAYADLFDSSEFVQADDAYYASLPTGPAFAGSRNLGSIEGLEEEVVPE